jgi:D-alanyl-D-alanine-carboxypeptidase/D-alanyl-D-alanine-endopeptidase
MIAMFQATQTRASDKLLDAAIQFTGNALFLDTKVPALVIGGVRNGCWVRQKKR